MHLYSAHLAGWASPADVFVQFYADEAYAFWLDRETHPTEPYSVIGAGTAEQLGDEPMKLLGEAAALHGYAGIASEIESLELPFSWRPGLVGALHYEGNSEGNGETGFIRVDRAIVFDHSTKSMYFLGLFANQSDFVHWHHAALLRLTLVGGQQSIYRVKHASRQSSARVALRHSPDNYLRMIEKAQEYIAAGDVYQICLTNELTIETQADPLYTFLKLREINAAPYSAYLRLANTVVVSSSPEQFLQVGVDGLISTKPIKGTRGRGAAEVEDQAIADELRENLKERAENLMIVDLMRNDLSRVALAESVSVTKLFEVESYATVHQLVSTVQAQLKPNLDVSDVLQAAFPGGSMTGAPKIRAMQIIRELELGPRGVYSGAIGYVGVDGSAEFGMVIRTLVFKAGFAKLGVGGGITSDSVPQAELAETQLKAQVLLRVLNAVDPWA
ncbi:MAG: hypothetical protein RL716_802 [Actinomycetota bacterium]|jgi:aminodeoxychorismate synthase component I|uniref:aminodeoxychorismate synthase component I n=1 Tax=Rhodoluna sp. TaxID=1969481 RepID=UPI0025EEC182|nr:aminodeoxychorismate synthase component I [Rhodoluna sp.]